MRDCAGNVDVNRIGRLFWPGRWNKLSENKSCLQWAAPRLGQGHQDLVLYAGYFECDTACRTHWRIDQFYGQRIEAEIDPDWDLPTEAVQNGLETLRSHLELVQGDAALLYETA